MAFVPALPGFSPVTYGQGYGNWQQYAGFNKDNPFGASRELFNPKKPPSSIYMAPVEDAVPVPVEPPATEIAPPSGQFGASSTGQFGAPPVGQLGGLSSGPSNPLSLADQARKHYGE